VLMWALMAAAMMAPTALPAFATYDDLGRSTQTRFGALVAGYLVIWLGFSVLAGAVQMALFGAGLVSAFGDSLSAWLSVGLLLVAGLYQFSPVKEACLSKCRAPLTFFMAHWDEGPLRNGLRLGLVCLGCCWALMLLAFVGGVMNIAFMGLATLIMVIEKLPQYGRLLTRPLGAALIAGAFIVALSAV
jgi:predicted metal-binding membrane protein